MAATLTTSNGYLVYTTETKTFSIPLSLLADCTIVKYTDFVSIILPSETNAHTKSFVDIYPVAGGNIATVAAIETILKSAITYTDVYNDAVKTLEVELTRPSDTNAYAANDCINTATSGSALLQFTNASKATGSGIIIASARFQTNSILSSGFLGKRFRLHLYRDSGVTAINDNAAFEMFYANSSKRFGYIDFTFPSTADGGSTDSIAVQIDGINKVVQLVGTSIYAQLQVLDTVTTPILGAKIKIHLHVIQTN